MLLTLKLARIATVLVPLKFTHAFARPDASLVPSLAVVTALAAMSAVVMQSSGRPPALMPVIVPEPLIPIGMTYTTTQEAPLGTVTVTPEFIVIGPALMAFLLAVKV